MGDYDLFPDLRATGPRKLLVWAEDKSEVGYSDHAVVAKSDGALASCVRAIMSKEPHAVLVAQYEGNVVLPPRWLAERVAALRQKNDASMFKSWVGMKAQERERDTGKLPSVLARCGTYLVPDGWELDPEDEGDRAMAERHSQCSACGGSMVVPATGTWETLFAAWRDLYRSDWKREPAPEPFEGLAADEDAPVLVLWPSGINRGVRLEEVTRDEDYCPSVHSMVHNGTPILFFQGRRLPEVCPEVRAVWEEQSRRFREKVERENRERDARVLEDVEKRRRVTNKMFGEE